MTPNRQSKASAENDLTITLHDREIKAFQSLIQSSTTGQEMLKRCRIILEFSEGKTKYSINKKYGIPYNTMSKWIKVWKSKERILKETDSDAEIKKRILSILKDAPRSGAPKKFQEHEVCNIIALACSNPEDVEVPLSHWSCRTLAREVVNQGLVKSISFKQIANFLKSGEVKTTQD